MTDAVLEGGLGILLVDGSFDRAHYALIMAAGALAVGRPVVLFCGSFGVRALARDWSGLTGSDADAAYVARGVAGFDTLRDVVVEFGGELMVCESGLRLAALAADDLCAGVAIAGVPSFLNRTKGCQIITL